MKRKGNKDGIEMEWRKKVSKKEREERTRKGRQREKQIAYKTENWKSQRKWK